MNQPGVYIVSLTNSQVAVETHPHCSISPAAVQVLLDIRPELRLDGARPTRDALADRIASMWLSDETILYVGLAGTSVAHRVDQYYHTPLGARSPHAGGWPLKALSDIDQLWVHFAPCGTVDRAEATMLKTFVANVSDYARASVCDPAVPLPFANLAIPGGARKKHGITGVREPRKVATTAHSAVLPTPPSTPRKAACLVPLTQPVRGADLAAGRIRIPAATKPVLPATKQLINVVLRGHAMEVRWDPRNTPGKSRSGVLGIGRARLAGLVGQDETLTVSIRADGSFELS